MQLPKSKHWAACCPSVQTARKYAMTKAIGSKSNLIFVTILKQNLPTVYARNALKSSTLNYSKNKKQYAQPKRLQSPPDGVYKKPYDTAQDQRNPMVCCHL